MRHYGRGVIGNGTLLAMGDVDGVLFVPAKALEARTAAQVARLAALVARLAGAAPSTGAAR